MKINAMKVPQAVKLVRPARSDFRRMLLAICAWASILFSITAAAQIEPRAADGSLDPSFGEGGRVVTDFFGDADIGYAVALQPDGKLLVAGSAAVGGANSVDFGLARYNPDGRLDLSFGVGGKVTTDFFQRDDFPQAVAVLPDGKILVAGGASADPNTRFFAVASYNPNGSLDPAFGTGGKMTVSFSGPVPIVNAVAIQPDGKVVLVGATGMNAGFNQIALARLNTNGTLDSSFGSGGKVTGSDATNINFANGIVLQLGGKIVISGYTGLAAASLDFMLVRYDSDGSLDTSFGANGRVTTDFLGLQDTGRSLLALPNGKLLVAGTAAATPVQNDFRFAMSRYNMDGSLDASFGTGGKVMTGFPDGGAFANAAAMQADGRILLAGGFRMQNFSNDDFALARYNSDGSPDLSFGTNGRVLTDFIGDFDSAHAIGLQPDGKIVVAGEAQRPQAPQTRDFAVARYIGTPPSFSLTPSQLMLAAERGAKAKVQILINRSAGFTGAVTVDPPDSNSAFKPKPSGPMSTTGNSIVFKLKIKSGAPTGPRQVIFVGRSEDGQVSTTTVTLNIQ